MRKTSFGLLLAVQSLTMLIGGLSIWFVPDPFPTGALILISSFAGGMTVLAVVVTVTALRSGARWAWLAMWVYPAFFVFHVIGLGTVVPDLILALVSAAALIGLRPGAEAPPRGIPAPSRASSIA